MRYGSSPSFPCEKPVVSAPLIDKNILSLLKYLLPLLNIGCPYMC